MLMSLPLVLRTRSELRGYTSAFSNGNLGFVPTMGALHEGHLSLVKCAVEAHEGSVVSIFVNPTQFGPNDDFHKYPRSLEQDLKRLAGSGVGAVFAPDVAEMYPEGAQTLVHVAGLTEGLCGPVRPGHFDGVATVVAKLFHAVGPCTAYFGRKDFQQLAVIRRMVADLFMPVRVEGVATLRDPDGLAMSSRNAYLRADERAHALCISRGLRAAQRAFAAGERRVAELHALVLSELLQEVSRIDYVSVVDPDSLVALNGLVHERALVAVAAYVGTTRLIDNTELGVDRSP